MQMLQGEMAGEANRSYIGRWCYGACKRKIEK